MLNYIKWHRNNYGKYPTYEDIKIHFPHLPETQIDSMITNLRNDGFIQIYLVDVENPIVEVR